MTSRKPRAKPSEAEQLRRVIQRDLSEHPRAIVRNRREASVCLLRGRPDLAQRLYETNGELARAAGLEAQEAEAMADFAAVLLELAGGFEQPDGGA